MLSPSMITRLNGNLACTRVICCATSYWGRSPVPLSPMAANFSESVRFGRTTIDCAKNSAHIAAVSTRTEHHRAAWNTRRPEAREESRSRGAVVRYAVVPMCRQFGLTLLIWLVAATSSFPQEPNTRGEADRRQRAEKNDSLRPYTPGGFERGMRFVEEK